jgi:Zn-dependent peptidase ImmA (M78 family)
MEARRKAQVPLESPICIYDFVEALGVEVRFVGGASFAGMYAKGHDVVFVPAERPAGRRAFTCAHELAHWRFGHGARVESLDFDREDCEIPEEILANQFAAYLLMPSRAIALAFKKRGILPKHASSLDIYAVACQLGVGYETLVKHLRWSESLIDHARMHDLQKIPPRKIRREVLGTHISGHLVVSDENWSTVPIDLEVGDYAIVPNDVSLNGKSAKIVQKCQFGEVVEAIQPGITQAVGAPDWAHMIRVSRKQFTGRGAFRHLEEEDENDNSTSNY